MKFRPQSASNGLARGHNPGPGSYDPNSSVIKHNQEAARIGTSKRSNNGASKDQILNPGPGAYEVEKGLVRENAPKIGTGKRNELYNSNQTPGPAQYMVDNRP